MTTTNQSRMAARRMLFVAVAIGLLSGCAMVNSLAPERIAATDLSATTGVVFLSAGAPKSCNSNGTLLTFPASTLPFGRMSLRI